MGADREPPVGIRLWPQSYVVARLREVPAALSGSQAGGPPVALVVGHDEVSLLAPEEVIQGVAGSVEHVSGGWRALTVEAVFPLGTVGFLAVVSRALAEVSVPVMVFSSHDTDHFLVPSEHLGRALAALNQARLERFIPKK